MRAGIVETRCSAIGGPSWPAERQAIVPRTPPTESSRSLHRIAPRADGGVAGEQTLADADQTLGDGDQTLSDADQTAADRDQTSADRDQLAADRDQFASDRDLAAGVDKRTHDRSQVIACAHGPGPRARAPISATSPHAHGCSAAAKSDEIAIARDVMADARDLAADARSLAMARLDSDPQQTRKRGR